MPQPPTAMQGGKRSFRWAGGRLGVNVGEKLPFVMLKRFASVIRHHKQPNADNLLLCLFLFSYLALGPNWKFWV